MQQVNEIGLTRPERRALKQVVRKDGVPLDREGRAPYARLTRLGLIERGYREHLPDDDCDPIFPANALVPTDLGISFVFLTARRYWITTAIAVVALILSIIAIARSC